MDVCTDFKILTVPGWTNSGPEHWMTRWEETHPQFMRVEQQDWQYPRRIDWVAELERSVASVRQPVILVAHSLGCLTVAYAAQENKHSVAAALLVAPCDVERTDAAPELRDFMPMPFGPLAYPTLTVASRNDPTCAFDRAEKLAASWGSRLIDAGSAGHINSASGHGFWPEGEQYFKELVAMLA
jgi:predicted alpha/beta hydrolase family esterase